MDSNSLVTILGIVLGSGAFSSMVNWLLKRPGWKTLTPDDLKPFNEKFRIALSFPSSPDPRVAGVAANVSVDVESILARYEMDMARLERRAVLAEARADALRSRLDDMESKENQ